MSSLAMFGGSQVAGLVLKWVVRHRLIALAGRTKGQWDDIVVTEFDRRVPLWSLLRGIYLAGGFWQLQPDVESALTKTLFTTGMIWGNHPVGSA